MWVNSPMDRETALCGGPKAPSFQKFLIYQDRKLKFSMHTIPTKWNTIMCICGG